MNQEHRGRGILAILGVVAAANVAGTLFVPFFGLVMVFAIWTFSLYADVFFILAVAGSWWLSGRLGRSMPSTGAAIAVGTVWGLVATAATYIASYQIVLHSSGDPTFQSFLNPPRPEFWSLTWDLDEVADTLIAGMIGILVMGCLHALHAARARRATNGLHP